jgi:hypothetical protein
MAWVDVKVDLGMFWGRKRSETGMTVQMEEESELGRRCNNFNNK